MGVRLAGVRSEMALLLPEVQRIVEKFDKFGDMTITSCAEGHHSSGSLHYSGAGIDIRSRNMTDKGKDECVMLLNNIHLEFQFVLESDHIHWEFQPREMGRR